MRSCLPLLAVLSLLLYCTACTDNEGPGSPIPPSARPIESKEGILEDYTNTNRDVWQKPETIFNLMGDLSEKTVADIGAGTGFFSLRLAAQADKVIAIDINPAFISYLDSVRVLQLPPAQRGRLETRLAKPDDPLLRKKEADLIMIVNTLPYIDNPVDYLRNLRPALREGGRIFIVDFKRKRLPPGIGPVADQRLPLHVVEEMLVEAGYPRFRSIDTALDYQYIVIAEE